MFIGQSFVAKLSQMWQDLSRSLHPKYSDSEALSRGQTRKVLNHGLHSAAVSLPAVIGNTLKALI